MSKNIPTNKELYSRVKALAKKKFDRWPSAYGSAWLVKEYKRRGGTYRKAEYGMEIDNPYADMYSVGGDYMYGGEEYSQGGMPEYKNGGIPERYRNMGFTRVGAKKKSTRPGKKWMVLAKKGDKYKVVHGGDSNMKDFKQHGSAKRKKRFWDRMGGRDSAKAKDPFSPLYWHKRFGTWAEGGEFEPHMMYDPETGKGFMADQYQDHVRMDEMGFTHKAQFGGDFSQLANFLPQDMNLPEGTLSENQLVNQLPWPVKRGIKRKLGKIEKDPVGFAKTVGSFASGTATPKDFANMLKYRQDGGEQVESSGGWDYKKVPGDNNSYNYYTRKAGSDNWIDLQSPNQADSLYAVRSKIFKDNIIDEETTNKYRESLANSIRDIDTSGYGVRVQQYPYGYASMPPGHIEAVLYDKNTGDVINEIPGTQYKTYVNRWQNDGNRPVKDARGNSTVRTADLALDDTAVKDFLTNAQLYQPTEASVIHKRLGLTPEQLPISGGNINTYDLANSNCADGVCRSLNIDRNSSRSAGITDPTLAMDNLLNQYSDVIQNQTGTRVGREEGLRRMAEKAGVDLSKESYDVLLDYVDGLDQGEVRHSIEELSKIPGMRQLIKDQNVAKFLGVDKFGPSEWIGAALAPSYYLKPATSKIGQVYNALPDGTLPALWGVLNNEVIKPNSDFDLSTEGIMNIPSYWGNKAKAIGNDVSDFGNNVSDFVSSINPFASFSPFKKGGINNPGFRALPPEVQDKITANMKMGGTPCYECGGSFKRGGMPKYQFAGSPGSVEEQLLNQELMADMAEQASGSTEKTAALNYGFNPFGENPETVLANWSLPNTNQKISYQSYEDKLNDPLGGFRANIDAAAGRLELPYGAYTKNVENLLSNMESKPADKMKPAQIAYNVADAASYIAGSIGKRNKEQRAKRDIQQRFMTDNLYTPTPLGTQGSRGDYNTFGEFRPDRVGNWNPYMMESYLQEGGEAELTDAQIARLRAMGADIEILD